MCRNSLSESQVTLVRKREEEAGDNAITGYSSSHSLLQIFKNRLTGQGFISPNRPSMCQPIMLVGTLGVAPDTCQRSWDSTLYGLARPGHPVQWANLKIGLTHSW